MQLIAQYIVKLDTYSKLLRSQEKVLLVGYGVIILATDCKVYISSTKFLLISRTTSLQGQTFDIDDMSKHAIMI